LRPGRIGQSKQQRGGKNLFSRNDVQLFHGTSLPGIHEIFGVSVFGSCLPHISRCIERPIDSVVNLSQEMQKSLIYRDFM
jgi:hypothetical protein